MFEHLADDKADQRFSFEFEGQQVEAKPGMTVSAALLVAGVTTFRHTFGTDEPRGPFCQMGACYECMVEIDGVSMQACMVEASPDLIVSRVKYPKIEAE